MASFRFPFRGLRSEFTRAAASESWGDLGQRLDRNFDEIERSAGAWRLIGGAGEPAFENTWSNLGGAYETAAYFKHPLTDIVYLRGVIRLGATGVPSFVLPVGCRPPARWFHAAIGYGPGAQLYQVDITADGEVIVSVGATAPTSVTIACSFRTS